MNLTEARECSENPRTPMKTMHNMAISILCVSAVSSTARAAGSLDADLLIVDGNEFACAAVCDVRRPSSHLALRTL